MSTIFLLGFDHKLQGVDDIPQCDQDVRNKEHLAKKEFRFLVIDLITRESVTFLGEECKEGQDTILKRIAHELRLAQPVEIDMTCKEREAKGIARDYQAGNPEETKRGYDLREDHMLKKVCSASPPGTRKLIVCGSNHLDGLKNRFEQRGESVSVRDLTKESWVKAFYQANAKFSSPDQT